jgi:hypothetical protein
MSGTLRICAAAVHVIVVAGCAIQCPDGSSIREGADEGTVRAQFGPPDALAEGDRNGQLRFAELSACRPKAVTEWYYLDRNAIFRFESGLLADVEPLGYDVRRSLVERQVELRRQKLNDRDELSGSNGNS